MLPAQWEVGLALGWGMGHDRGMNPTTRAGANHLGRNVRSHLPDPDSLPGLPTLDEGHQRIWALAAPYLRTRRNDIHSLFAFSLAAAMLEFHPEADRNVVLPAILLHDTGWSQVPADEVLEAIAPGGGRPDLVRLHETEGARIAEEILHQVGHPETLIPEVLRIIDGHDSRRESLSINDSIVKDADKVWRVTPWGLDVITDWFGLTRSETLTLCASRVHGHLFTDAGRAMAMGLTALESMNGTPDVDAVR